MGTEVNLKTAFAGESQANRRYMFFAKKADAEGLPQIARLFRAVAEAETVHARNHFDVMDAVGSTRENLKTAADGESYEFLKMYPGFIEEAKAEKDQDAEVSFTYANNVEKIHYNLYQKALKTLEAGKKLPDASYFVCQRCGNTVSSSDPPDKCPICGAPNPMFKRIE